MEAKNAGKEAETIAAKKATMNERAVKRKADKAEIARIAAGSSLLHPLWWNHSATCEV